MCLYFYTMIFRSANEFKFVPFSFFIALNGFLSVTYQLLSGLNFISVFICASLCQDKAVGLTDMM